MPSLSKGGRRIVVLCEGDTEELAVREFVRRRWEEDGLGAVGLQTINLGGKIQKTGVHAGLSLDNSEVLAVFTLIDLYGMKFTDQQTHVDLASKVQLAQQRLRAQVDHPRSSCFFPHLCVHETEAWVLAEGEALGRRLRDSAICPDYGAESRNFLNPPSKVINQYFHRRLRTRYNKIGDGRPLFTAMRFEPVYKSCGYFRAFYDALRAVVTTQWDR